MTDNDAGRSTALTAALTAVLIGCIVVLATSDSLGSGLRYGIGAVAVAGVLVCAYRLGVTARWKR